MTLTALLGIARGYDLVISGARVQELVKEAYALGYGRGVASGGAPELGNDDPAWDVLGKGRKHER